MTDRDERPHCGDRADSRAASIRVCRRFQSAFGRSRIQWLVCPAPTLPYLPPRSSRLPVDCFGILAATGKAA